MRRLIATLPLALLLVACSPTPAPPSAPSQNAPINTVLGSHAWYTWVDRQLGITDDGHGPDPGSDEWNQAVQHKLGQEAPQSTPGSPQWQQSVDALLRTRLPPAS
ncbi:MAG: hypothetical protein ABI268_03770 [Rhodanobacter sp.]